jgi:hypothetical protein
MTTYTTASADARQFIAADDLIGLTVRPDDDCPACGEGVSIIKAAKPPHVGALVCVGCGKHRGWLPRHARDFITETIKQFGRPNEPIAYRRGLSSTEGNIDVKHFDNTNRGSLFSNKEGKKVETDADYSGSININGVEYWLKGWSKVAKTSGKKFLSLSVRPKTEKPKPAAPFNDDVGF